MTELRLTDPFGLLWAAPTNSFFSQFLTGNGLQRALVPDSQLPTAGRSYQRQGEQVESVIDNDDAPRKHGMVW